MKKIKKIFKHKKNLIIITIVISIILFFLSFIILNFIISSNPSGNINSKKDNIVTNNQKKVDYNSPTTEQKQAGEDQKRANQTPISTTFSTTITAKNVTNDLLQIRSMTSGVISSSGVCNLKLTNGEKVILKTVSTYAMPSTSTCQGFDIARTELPNGTWQISLDVIINGEKSSATSEALLR